MLESLNELCENIQPEVNLPLPEAEEDEIVELDLQAMSCNGS